MEINLSSAFQQHLSVSHLLNSSLDASDDFFNWRYLNTRIHSFIHSFIHSKTGVAENLVQIKLVDILYGTTAEDKIYTYD